MTGDPIIDLRTAADIVTQALALRSDYTPDWTPGDGDRGLALISIFARLMEIMIDRLNRVPENNFLAFLDTAGVHLLPPNAARVPVKFTPTAGAQGDGVVPAGTQLATAPPPGQEPLSFETEKELIVSRSQLAYLFAHDPGADRYSDLQAVIAANAQNESAPFAPFMGTDLIPHRLFLSQDTLFQVGQLAQLTLTFTFAQPASDFMGFFQTGLRWSIQSSGQPDIDITPAPADVTLTANTIGVLLKSPLLTTIDRTTIDSTEGNWLQVQTKDPLSADNAALILQSVTVSSAATGIKPLLAFCNAVSLDLSRECYPFGEKPKTFDTFFLAVPEVFTKTGSSVTWDLQYTQGTAKFGVELTYDFWNGTSWEKLGVTGPGSRTPVTTYKFKDETNAFTVSPGTGKQITFDCPEIAPVEVNGQASYWVRVRITAGNYGEDAKLSLITSPPPPNPTLADWKYDPPSFQPPIITSLSLSYAYATPQPLTSILTENNFVVAQVNPAGAFQPFAAPSETQPACYLGFDAAFSPQAISLYLAVDDRVSADQSQVVWEYWNGARWANLGVQDETRNFTTSGLIGFLGPADLALKSWFGKQSYWIRARLESGSSALRAFGVYPNTTWAKNCITITDELLGASAEVPGATFTLSRVPVLPGLKIAVREPEQPSPAELAVLFEEEGDDAVTPIPDSRECWVRWHQVEDFRFSGEQSRHYLVDWYSGLITFGDGTNGMIPPAGQDNIRAQWYQAGGGKQGNVPRNSVTVLKRAIPFVDKAYNVDQAGGGSDGETLDQVKTRGPQTIKNQDRAVTWEDYEWLAREASLQVARARCLPASTQQDAGIIRMIVVPWSDDPQPQPSQGLKAQIEDYINTSRRRIATASLLIINPKYVSVSVTANVFPVLLEEADLVRRQVKAKLTEYFHPLRGGPDGRGWEFGRDVFDSEVSAVIEGTTGVDHAENVTVFKDALVTEDSLIASGEHNIIIKF